MSSFKFVCCLIVLGVYIIIPHAYAASPAPRGTQAHGHLPGPGDGGVYALRTAQAWQKFQTDVRLNWDVSVDFNRDMVIAVFLGTRNTAGYKVDIREIRSEEHHTEITYSEGAPAATAMATQMISNPYILAVIERPANPVVFSKGFFGAVQIPYGEFTLLNRQMSEMSYQLEDERRQKTMAQGRVRDLVDLMARTGASPAQ